MILNVENIGYKINKKKIIENISLSAENGDFIVVLGNNGAGKSTLLKCISHILPYQEGVITVNGSDLNRLSRLEIAQNIAHVAQENTRINCTVYDSILLGRKPYIKWNVNTNDKEIVNDIIEKMGMEHLAMKSLEELSGGELQKVIIARSLVQEPKLLLMDEPTNNLDLKNQLDVLQLVKNICKERHIAAITILHDLSIAARFGEKFIFIKNNTIKAFGGIEVLNAKTIEEVYNVPVAVENVSGRLTIVPL